MSLEHLGGDAEQFVWIADYGGDVDLLGYGAGRVNFLANYEAIVGEEFRRFDPNQGNYILDVSSSLRRGALELAVVFHHVSRHLSDRPKTFHIDWNMVGIQAVRPVMIGSSRLHLHGRALWTAPAVVRRLSGRVRGGNQRAAPDSLAHGGRGGR